MQKKEYYINIFAANAAQSETALSEDPNSDSILDAESSDRGSSGEVALEDGFQGEDLTGSAETLDEGSSGQGSQGLGPSDEAATEKEETPDPLENWPIEVLDADFKPIGGARFTVIVDLGEEKKKKTGQDGIMKTLEPQKEITVALSG